MTQIFHALAVKIKMTAGKKKRAFLFFSLCVKIPAKEETNKNEKRFSLSSFLVHSICGVFFCCGLK
jgi:hypothetical protein